MLFEFSKFFSLEKVYVIWDSKIILVEEAYVIWDFKIIFSEEDYVISKLFEYVIYYL